MHTLIDGLLLSDFFESQPSPLPLGDEFDNERWNSFWKFLKSETNLEIPNCNFSSPKFDLFLSQLTTGRGDTKITSPKEPFKSPHKNIIKNAPVKSFFCLNEENEQARKRYVEKNGYLIGFKNDYLRKWEDFKLLGKKTVRSVRKENNNKSTNFTSWELFNDYLTTFTDVVIVDNYLFSDETLLPSNFEKILLQLDRATNVKYNLTIYTFEGTKFKLDGSKEFDRIKEIKKQYQLKCDVELVIATSAQKEHDRGIFTNYLRIKSGDSFNYFDSKGNVITKGTDIDFVSMADPTQEAVANLILRDLSSKIQQLRDKKGDTHVFGNCKNALLNF